MAAIKEHKILENGEHIVWSPDICNTGRDTCLGLTAELKVPDGLKLSNVDTKGNGVFNFTTNTWVVGDLQGSDDELNCVTIVFDFVVEDIRYANFRVSIESFSSCVGNSANNVAYLDIIKDEGCKVNLTIGDDDNCNEQIKLG